MKVKIFNDEVNLRDHHCQFFDNDLIPVDGPSTNLYIRTKFCNAKCKFCTFSRDASLYNEEKYIQALTEISSKVRIKKIAFSGGEPTLNFKKFKRMVEIAKKIIPNSEYSVNTDGLRLQKLYDDEIFDYFDFICLSRHHFDDMLNNEVFGFNSPSTDLLREIQNNSRRNILHFSCNLIKGYVDNKDKIYQYLEFANSLQVNSVGLVSLMPVNDYSKENFIDFNIKDLINERFNLTKEWKYKNMCKCNNYVYLPENLRNPIRVYHKNTYNPFDIQDSIVFDGENVKLGFSGKTIF